MQELEHSEVVHGERCTQRKYGHFLFFEIVNMSTLQRPNPGKRIAKKYLNEWSSPFQSHEATKCEKASQAQKT